MTSFRSSQEYSVKIKGRENQCNIVLWYFPSVPGIIGCMQALEALKIAAGIGCILMLLLCILSL